ncbi:hypothetical protein M0R04_15665 [Candidatus Dojkabacteria bacterium]|jgi:hypothetical protein|nr:hypothetical protein [Candidatus Dojkabacteria bacterium]
MAVQIQLRRDISGQWISGNPVLTDGELGFEKDTRRFKVGSGSTWSTTNYYECPLVTATTAVKGISQYSGSHFAVNSGNVTLNTNVLVNGINFIMDNGGSLITTGIKGDFKIPYNCKITKAGIYTKNASGAILIDCSLWKNIPSLFPPSGANLISSGATLRLSGAIIKEDSTLTGWTTDLSGGDIVRVNVNSITAISGATIYLELLRVL